MLLSGRSSTERTLTAEALEWLIELRLAKVRAVSLERRRLLKTLLRLLLLP